MATEQQNTDHGIATVLPSTAQHSGGTEEKTTRPSSAVPGDEIARSQTEMFIVMAALCISLFLAALDSTIVTTAVPTIAAHFDSSLGYVWIGSAYLLGTASFVPLWGEISNIFGRKPILILAVAVFLLDSLLCGVATNIEMLIAARAIQTLGSGGAIVLPNLCISDLFPLRKRGMYFGILGIVWAVASALGPVLGGVFTSKVSWRWAFYINLPVGGVALVVLVLFLKLHNPRTPMRQGLSAIDWTGNGLVIGATLMLLLGLEFGGIELPWRSATIICLLVFSAVTLGIFIAYEACLARYPVIPLRIFRGATNTASLSLPFLHAISFLGGSYWLPLYFQSVLGADALRSGVYLLPFVISLSICSALVGAFIKQTGEYKVPILAGFAISTLGFGLFTYLEDRTRWERIILFQIIAGIGIGPNFQAPLIALQSNVHQRDVGASTTTFAFLRQIGNAVSVTVGGVVLNSRMSAQNSELTRTLGSNASADFDGGSAAASAAKIATLPPTERQVVQTAYWTSLQAMFIMYTGFCFLGLLVSILIKRKQLTERHTEYKTGLESLEDTRISDRHDHKEGTGTSSTV
jgi:EmrB/QacA subfamily drug resistance transporter